MASSPDRKEASLASLLHAPHLSPFERGISVLHSWRAVFTAGALLLAPLLGITRDAQASPQGIRSAVPSSPPEARLGQSRASYRIRVRLDENSHRLHGQGSLILLNRSRAALDELWFHLYLNAFENERTLFLRGPVPGGRSGRLRDSQPGHIEVERLHSPRFGSLNLWEKAAPHSPEDPQDRTDIRVPLPEPIAPGEQVEFEFEFTAQLPEIVERTGFRDDFHLVAQWFPKLAKLEPDGSFAHFAFHPFSEFYADFGDYEIELDVPRSFVVGSSGKLEKIGEDGARARYFSRANDVHDFAWTASPHFSREERKIGHVEVTLLSDPRAKRVNRDTWDALERGLPFYQTAYGSYPYDTLTVVRPPSSASRAGGMEYPTFITTGGKERSQFVGARFAETVTAHELAHQWFQGILASNEARYPFLDEGLTSHAEWRFLDHAYGKSGSLALPGLSISRAAVGRYSGSLRSSGERVNQAARDFPSFRALASLVYGRTALSLETLRRTFGPPAYDEALLTYASRHRFSHPTPADLYQVIEEKLGEEARRALEALLERRATLDLRLGEITTNHSQSAHDSSKATAWLTRIPVIRSGELELPYEVLLKFRDGTQELRRVARPSSLEILEVHHDVELSRVEIDPERKLLIDADLLNNRAFLHSPPSSLRSTARFVSLAQWLQRGLF